MSDKNTTGAVSELLAAAWLMELGFDVFRNMSPAGPADLIAWRRGDATKYLIDVKSLSSPYVRRDGEYTVVIPGPHLDNVHYLVVSKGHVIGFFRRVPGFTSEQYDPFTEEA